MLRLNTCFKLPNIENPGRKKSNTCQPGVTFKPHICFYFLRSRGHTTDGANFIIQHKYLQPDSRKTHRQNIRLFESTFTQQKLVSAQLMGQPILVKGGRIF